MAARLRQGRGGGIEGGHRGAGMDETAIAFEPPHARAAATRPPGLADRISVRDYTRSVEIGAYRAERGVSQRVRFNVVLEVAHHVAAQDDDVDKVLSYEMIVEAIEAALSEERLNLLETLAERVAAGCLADRRALRVFVRVEKLDRLPDGTFGVEIMRVRLPEDAPRLRAAPEPPAAPAPRMLVVHIAPPLLAGPAAAAWLDAFAGLPVPAALTLGPAAPQPPARAEGALRIGLLAIEAAAWALADRDPRLVVVSARSELDWALKSGRRPVWAPVKMLTDALPRPVLDASDPAGLAAWLAAGIGAEALVLAGADLADPPEGLALRRAGRPAELGG